MANAETVYAVLYVLREAGYEIDFKLGTQHSLQLVSKGWAGAVASATRSLCVERCRNADNLKLWMSKHAAALQQLCVSFYGPYSRLPEDLLPLLQKLHSLQLHGCGVPEGLGSSLAAAAALTSLTLSKVTVHVSTGVPARGDTAFLPSLAALTALQHLSLSGMELRSKQQITKGRKQVSTTVSVPVAVPADLLQQLTALTHLELSSPGGLSGAALEGLAGLSRLQHLVLGCAGSQLTAAELAGVQQLQGCLTFLQLSDPPFPVSADSMPYLDSLAALRGLCLAGPQRWVALEPAAVAHMTGLQRLSLSRVTLRGSNATRDALRWVQANTQLTQLQLCRVDGLAADESDVQPAGYAALASPPMLQHLELRQLQLPSSAWQQMFEGDVLQQVTKLQLSDEFIVLPPLGWLPALRQLDAVHPPLKAPDLHLLAGIDLTSLFCTIRAYDDDDRWHWASCLTCIKGLQALRLSNETTLDPQHLRVLTKLQQLTYLGLDCEGVVEHGPHHDLAMALQEVSRPAHASKAGDPWSDEPRWVLTNKWRAGLSPVSAQLDAACPEPARLYRLICTA